MFDFSVPTSHEVFINGDFGDIYFKSARDFKSLVGNLSSIFGRMPKLPQWTYDGIIMGVQGGTEIVSVVFCGWFLQYKQHSETCLIQHGGGGEGETSCVRMGWVSEYVM